jgi:hypothetical protein
VEKQMTESRETAQRYTRRGVLGASAALGMVAAGAPAALAATTGERSPDRLADTRPHDGEPDAGTFGQRTADPREVWGASASGQGIGVRGSGRLGVLGEGTHTGVAGDGFIGVHGITSNVQVQERGVGVWAQAETPGSTALRADGPSRFNGETTFSRSGVVTVRAGSASVTQAQVAAGADTVILATLQRRVPQVYLHAVETDPAAESFTIFLTAAPHVDVPIAWFALG